MIDMDSPAAQKLLKAFMQFKKKGWHEDKIGGYNPSEFKVLAAIQRHANENETEMKVSEISQVLQVSSPTVTQIINGLEKSGLVERNIDPDDRRAVKIKLTPAGLEATAKARKAFTDQFLGLIEFLGEEESAHLADLLLKVHDYFNGKSR